MQALSTEYLPAVFSGYLFATSAIKIPRFGRQYADAPLDGKCLSRAGGDGCHQLIMLIQEPNLFIMLMLLAVVGCAVPTALAQLEQQDIFVRGKSGYHTYRIPSLLVTTKGTLLAFCEGRKNSASDTGDIDLLLKRSADGGRTWGQHQVVWDDGPNTCGNPCPVLDETAGVVWLLMTHNPAGLNERQIQARKVSGGRTVWVTRSEDDGKSWSAPSNITSSAKDPAWGWYATGPGVGIQIQHGPHKGRMIIPCDHSYPSPSASPGSLSTERGAHVIYSDDHGQTWRLGGTVRPKMNECQIAELADGEGGLLLTLRF